MLYHQGLHISRFPESEVEVVATELEIIEADEEWLSPSPGTLEVVLSSGILQGRSESGVL